MLIAEAHCSRFVDFFEVLRRSWPLRCATLSQTVRGSKDFQNLEWWLLFTSANKLALTHCVLDKSRDYRLQKTVLIKRSSQRNAKLIRIFLLDATSRGAPRLRRPPQVYQKPTRPANHQ